MPNEAHYNKIHLANLDKLARQVYRLYLQAIQEAVKLGLPVEHDPEKPFAFANYPNLQSKVNKLLAKLASQAVQVIQAGNEQEWLLAEQKNDDLVKSLFGENPPKAISERFLARNLSALERFQKRKTDGMDLSKRVWSLVEGFQSELEMALDVGLLDGRSAAKLSQDVRKYLEEPNKLFRRVRDARGVLHLSKAAKNYHPGQGIYRSSHKNAIRLTRTEVNMAYKESDYERWQSLDFVVGVRIRRSNHPYGCSVCESLQGDYPKSFKFRGWHPQCRCVSTSILASREELSELTKRALNGDDLEGFTSKHQVSEVPPQFTDWMNANNERLLRAKSLPYFVRDNFKKGIQPAISKQPSIIEKTRQWAPEFGKLSNDIANSTGSLVTPVNFKSDKRIMEKAKNDYGGNVEDVKDIIRNTFIVRDQTQYEAVLNKVQTTFKVVKLKNQEADKDPMGYSGTLIQIQNGSIFAEIQINTPQIIYGKEVFAKEIIGEKYFNLIKKLSGLEHGLGHAYYEAFRVLDEKIPEEEVKLIKLKKASKEYYAKLRSLNL